MKPQDLLLAWMRPHDCSGDFFESVLSLDQRWNGQLAWHRYVSGPIVGQVKNDICRDFLDMPRYKSREWLCIADADMAFTAGEFELFLSYAHPTKHPLLGGLCNRLDPAASRKYPVQALLDEDGFHGISEWPPNALIDVDYGGGGVILAHRDALEKMRADADDPVWPWFEYGSLNGKPVDESYGFWLKAKAAGFQGVCPTAVTFLHDKWVTI